MPESLPVMSSNPRQEQWTGGRGSIYQIEIWFLFLVSSQSHSLSQGRNEDDISSLGYEENYPDTGTQQGLCYGMLDEAGAPYEPVKLKTISLCCYEMW